MRLAAFEFRGTVGFGVVQGDEIVDLTDLWPDLIAFLAAGNLAVEAARHKASRPGRRLALTEIEWLPPSPRPGKIVCAGLNYRSHMALLNEPPAPVPVLFMKPLTSLIGSGRPILLPHVSRQVDYEGELAVVIGKRGKYIPEDQALDYVGGYTCANDASAHDIEFQTSQWTSGKMLDTFCPLGPVLLTADDVPDPARLRLQTRLNGELVQDESVSDMYFSVPALIAFISSLSVLEPGDIILTGTPAGLGCMRDPQVFLKPGDEVSVTIGGIGTLSNPVASES